MKDADMQPKCAENDNDNEAGWTTYDGIAYGISGLCLWPMGITASQHEWLKMLFAAHVNLSKVTVGSLNLGTATVAKNLRLGMPCEGSVLSHAKTIDYRSAESTANLFKEADQNWFVTFTLAENGEEKETTFRRHV